MTAGSGPRIRQRVSAFAPAVREDDSEANSTRSEVSPSRATRASGKFASLMVAVLALAITQLPSALGAQSLRIGGPSVVDSARLPRAARAILEARLPVEDVHLGEIPAFSSLNPSITSRSGLAYQPFRLPRSGWILETRASYANIIEYEITDESRYLLDAEVGRAEVELGHDLGDRAWVTGTIGLGMA